MGDETYSFPTVTSTDIKKKLLAAQVPLERKIFWMKFLFDFYNIPDLPQQVPLCIMHTLRGPTFYIDLIIVDKPQLGSLLRHNGLLFGRDWKLRAHQKQYIEIKILFCKSKNNNNKHHHHHQMNNIQHKLSPAPSNK